DVVALRRVPRVRRPCDRRPGTTQRPVADRVDHPARRERQAAQALFEGLAHRQEEEALPRAGLQDQERRGDHHALGRAGLHRGLARRGLGARPRPHLGERQRRARADRGPRPQLLRREADHPRPARRTAQRDRHDHGARPGQTGQRHRDRARPRLKVHVPERLRGFSMAVHPEPMDPHRLLRHVLGAALAVVLMLAGGANPASAAPRATTTTLSLSHTALFKGEMVWLKGKVTTRSGKGVKGVKVRLERRVDGGKWRKVATLKTRKNGTFSQRQRPAKEYTYRARVLGSSKAASSRSTTRSVHFVKGTDRGLGNRAKLLKSVLGKGKRAVRTVKVKGTDRVRYREYAKGMLVEVKKKGERRTWLVYGDIYRAYRKAGGPKG